MKNKSLSNLTRGIVRENPVFVMMLGMCPTLGVTTSLENALGMGVATAFTLLLSNCVISLCKNFIPAMVRIPCYIVLIASIVTVIDMMMAARAAGSARQTGDLYSADRGQLHHSRPCRGVCLEKQRFSIFPRRSRHGHRFYSGAFAARLGA